MKAIVDAVLDDSYTLAQQVYALVCQAIKHRRMKLVGASAGLFAGSGKDFDEQIVTNIHDTLELHGRLTPCMEEPVMIRDHFFILLF